MPDQPQPISDAQRQRNEATYHLALGRFVDAFARLENLLRLVLFRYARTPHPIGPAVFSGARTRTIHSFLKRLAEVSMIAPNEWTILKPVLDQLAIIADKRDDILHYGGQAFGSGTGFVTNALTTLNERTRKVFPISAPILTHMTFDCEKIILHLLAEHMGIGELRAALPPEQARMLQDAWQYKLPPPNQNRSPPGDARPGRPAPPKPSPE